MLAYAEDPPGPPYVCVYRGQRVAIRDGVSPTTAAVLVTIPDSIWVSEAWNAVLRQAAQDRGLLESLADRQAQRSATDPVYFTVVTEETGNEGHNRPGMPVATFDFYF